MFDEARHRILSTVASQRGLITRAQIERLPDARRGMQVLAEMEISGDLEMMVDDVWAHSAVRSVSEPIGEAEALWLLTGSERTLTERREEFIRNGASPPVIGGLPALAHWGFGYAPVETVVTVPPNALIPVAVSDLVSVRTNLGTAAHDIDWQHENFPYRGAEATLVDLLREGIGLDVVAGLLSTAMWTLHPMRPDLLLWHLTHLAAEEGLSVEHGRRTYADLVSLAGGWPEKPGARYGETWVKNRPAVDALLSTEAADAEADPVTAAARRADRMDQLREIEAARHAGGVDVAVAIKLVVERTHDDLDASSIPSAAAAKALGITTDDVLARARRDDLHSYETPSGRLFPDWQFGSAGVVPHVAEVLDAVAEFVHPASLQGFMTTAQSGLIRAGRSVSPRHWLLDGGDPAVIVNRLAVMR
jgi:hypothetical protein